MTNSTTSALTGLLNSGIQLHKEGNFTAATLIYKQILQQDPCHFDALHFSGVIAKQTGHPEQSIEFISAAIDSAQVKFNASHASAFCNLGAAQQECLLPLQALTSYQKAIQLKPNYAVAHHNLGNTLTNLGRYEEAILSYHKAIDYLPVYPEAFYHCGLALHLNQQFEPALQHFEQAVRYRPNYAEAINASGISLHRLARLDSAIQNYSRAIQLKPDFAQAYFNRGVSYNQLQQFDTAAADFELAIHYQPHYPNAFFYLGNSCRHLNDYEQAIASYRRARELGADPHQIDFLLATLGAAPAPDAAPITYVKELFDQYADHFDAHLTQVLNYAVPDLIATTLAPHWQDRPNACLDLGCGTGLCGHFLRQHASSLTGVDLSNNMLVQAERLNLYDSLVSSEITDFLFGSNQQFDLITAADVLIYFGDLNRVMQGVNMVLHEQGMFCFSVEELNNDVRGDDYILQTSARYAHSESYLRRLAQHHCLKVIEIRHHTGRHEGHVKSAVLIVLLQKVAGSSEI